MTDREVLRELVSAQKDLARAITEILINQENSHKSLAALYGIVGKILDFLITQAGAPAGADTGELHAELERLRDAQQILIDSTLTGQAAPPISLHTEVEALAGFCREALDRITKDEGAIVAHQRVIEKQGEEIAMLVQFVETAGKTFKSHAALLAKLSGVPRPPAPGRVQ